MRLICFWCLILAATVHAQNDYYAPQTFKQNLDDYQSGLFTPAANDVTPQSSQAWRSGQEPAQENWREANNVQSPSTASIIPKPEPWRSPYPVNKEHRASILHHKQALNSDGSFSYEYSSDNGQAAGEVIEPDGSRLGAYQYNDPSGQLVKIKYRAGKNGFQILEGSHVPKSPEPTPPQNQDNYYQHAYAQQRQQYDLQQQYNQQKPEPQQNWKQNEGYGGGQPPAGGQYFERNWTQQDLKDNDGQYHDKDVENKVPHSFGGGYAFSFKG